MEGLPPYIQTDLEELWQKPTEWRGFLVAHHCGLNVNAPSEIHGVI